MDAINSVSTLWYRKSRPLGKVRRRVQDLRIPSSSYYDFTASRPRLDLSHNESARLAADCLLSHGLEGYHEVLKAEGEVDFLSELDKNYILENGGAGNTGDTGSPYEEDKEFESLSAGFYSRLQCSSVSADSESSVEKLNQRSLKDVESIDPILDDTSVEVFFQSDISAAGMKDLVRQFISKAKLVRLEALAIVMDSFSDTELLCDLLEVSRKRNVSVHLLLDHLNLNLFLNMWQDLQLNSKNFPKLSVRSVHGLTYCARTGRKLTGQVSESFIITDWTDVLTGSYSFTWLSWQVHRSLAVLIKGSSASSFRQEFHRLYSSSEPVAGFVNFITVPQTFCLSSSSHTAQSTNIAKSKESSDMTKTTNLWTVEDCEKTKAEKSVLCDLPSPEVKCSEGGNQSVRAAAGSHTETKPLQLHQSGAEYRMQTVCVKKSQHTEGAVCIQLDGRSNVEPLGRNQAQIDCHSNPVYKTLFPEVQSQLASIIISPTPEKNLTVQAGMATHLRSQPQADSTPFLSGTSAKKHPQIYTYQQTNPSPRLNWTPQIYQSAGPRNMVCHNSFSSTHLTGQLGWKPLQSPMTAPLGRKQEHDSQMERNRPLSKHNRDSAPEH